MPHSFTRFINAPYAAVRLQKPVRVYRRIIKDIPPILPRVTEHVVNGYWYPQCKKVVTAKVTDALANARIGLRLMVFTAWLHYMAGVSVDNLVAMLSAFSSVKVRAGGLTQF